MAKKESIITVKEETEIKERVTTLLEAKGMTISTFIRMKIRELLNKEE